MPDDRHRTHERIGRPLATGGTKALFCKITLFCRSRAGAVKPRPPLDDLSPFDSIFLILRRVGVCTRIDPTLLAEFPRRQNLTTYLAAALHHLCGKPIPAPLNCHSAGRGTSVPTGNTDLTPL